MDLHESTANCIKGKDGDSEQWIPERGLREGCSTSPTLSNIFHQVVMRIADNKRKSENGSIGVEWEWIPGSKFPNTQRIGNYNSESIEISFSLSLFADDTTPLGETRETDSGV